MNILNSTFKDEIIKYINITREYLIATLMNCIGIQKGTSLTTKEGVNNYYLYVEQYKQYDPGKLIYLSYFIKKSNKNYWKQRVSKI